MAEVIRSILYRPLEYFMRARSVTVLATVALFAVAIASTFAADTAKELIVGKWQPNDKDGEKATVEFTKDGKVKVVADPYSLDGTYKFVKDDQIEVTMPIAGKESTVKLIVKVTKDELTTTDETKDDKGKEKIQTFKRVK
jgi:uncharacterized protein (TIGR03066 family)